MYRGRHDKGPALRLSRVGLAERLFVPELSPSVHTCHFFSLQTFAESAINTDVRGDFFSSKRSGAKSEVRRESISSFILR